MSCLFMFFFFKQKTAYEMRISDWSSDVCSSDLDRLEAAGHLLGIATGKARRGLNYTLASHGLTGRFVTLQTSDVVTAGKPAPDMALQAMAEAGAVPASTIVVGDTTYDIEMARNAGVAAIGVARGYHDKAKLLGAGVSRINNRKEGE